MAVSLYKSFSYGMYLKVEVLGHKGFTSSILLAISKLLPKTVMPIDKSHSNTTISLHPCENLRLKF